MASENPKLVVGNWKMKPETLSEAKKIVTGVKKAAAAAKKADVVLCPPAIFLSELKRHYKGRAMVFGGQNAFWEPVGSYTGKTSPKMLADMGAKFLILGHSERRALGETNEQVNQKIHAALKEGLHVIFCFGEPKRDRRGDYLVFLHKQLRTAFKDVTKAHLKSITVAYEPIWAIGTGEAMQPHEVHEMVIFVRKFITENYSRPAGNALRILYGGSVDPENAAELFEQGNVDGFLIGGVSQKPKEFSRVIKIANDHS